MITSEMGQPTGTYESSYGAILNYVWGAKFGDSPSLKEIRQAPFSVSMIRDLTCANYGDAQIEFYSEGEQIRP